MAKKIEPSKSDKDSVATKDSISKKAEPKPEPPKELPNIEEIVKKNLVMAAVA